MAEKKGKCRVPLCVALADPVRSEWIRRINPEGLCIVHQEMPEDALREALKRTAGLVGPLEPVTDRIEYDGAGEPVRFYPATR